MLLKRLFSLLLSASAAVLLLPGGAALGQALPTIRVASPPSEDAAPLLYALHEGLFTKYGVNVQLTQMTSGSAIAAAVAGKAVDVGFSSLQAIISGHVRGVPFELVTRRAVRSERSLRVYAGAQRRSNS